MRLHRIHIRRRQPGIRQRRTNHPLLCGTVRRRQAAAGAVLVDRRAPHHREHPVTVAPRVRQPLQQEHAHALGEAGAVRAVGEGAAAAVGGQSALAAEFDVDVGRRHDGDTAGQRHRALAAPQRLHCQVQRHQRRRARRVDGDRGALEAEGVGDATGGDTVGIAVADISFEFVGNGVEPGRVVLVHHSGEYAG